MLLQPSIDRNINREILRTGIIAELDAINLYEQIVALTPNKKSPIRQSKNIC